MSFPPDSRGLMHDGPQERHHLLPQPRRLHRRFALGHLPPSPQQRADDLVRQAAAGTLALGLPRHPLVCCVAVPASPIHASLSATARQARRSVLHAKGVAVYTHLATRHPSHDSIGASALRTCPHPRHLWGPMSCTSPCRCCDSCSTASASSPCNKATHARCICASTRRLGVLCSIARSRAARRHVLACCAMSVPVAAVPPPPLLLLAAAAAVCCLARACRQRASPR